MNINKQMFKMELTESGFRDFEIIAIMLALDVSEEIENKVSNVQ